MKVTNDALLEAASQGDAKTVQALLSKSSPAQDRKSLNLALGRAVKSGHAKVVELLLKAGADPDSKAVSNSLLIEAAESGDLEVVKVLVKAGADIHRKVAGADAFAAVLEMDQVKVAEYLKSQGADWATPTLRHACEHGDVKRAQEALDAGAKVESKCLIRCDTPLTLAAGNGNAPLVRLLLKRGANPNSRVEGKTALYDAAKHGRNLETVNALVEAGANIHADWDGETVLMAAAGGGTLAIVKRLIELGADVRARDKNHGNGVMDYAKSSKNKELIAYLQGLGATAERDAGRTLIHALAKQFGGKHYEHVNGFTLNFKLASNKCQFHFHPDHCSLGVFGLKYTGDSSPGKQFPEIKLSSGKPEHLHGKLRKSETARRATGLDVYSPVRADDAEGQAALGSFCTRLKGHLDSLKLMPGESLDFFSNSAGFRWVGTDVETVRARLLIFSSLIQAITRPQQPERRLFAGEWLLKPAPKSVAATHHRFGGKLEQPVGCSRCASATNLMAQVDLADPLLPKTALGRIRLPVFWCLDCLEWDAAFFDVSGQVPRPFNQAGKKANPAKLETGEADLPECRVMLVPVATGKKAGRKSKLGGSPTWIQMEETPNCPKCEKPMGFVLQLASDSRISYCDMGMLYAFACPDCRVTASLIQSH